MGRSPCCEKTGLKRGPWTQEEDQKLIDYIQKYGYGKWRSLPKNAGLQRCGKSCRLRWTNYLRPDIKRGRFSLEEEETIIHLHSILGNKWSAIAARLPGRTDNEIKNFWNTNIRKKLLRMGIDPVTHNPRLDLLDLPSMLSSLLSSCNSDGNFSGFFGVQSPLMSPQLVSLANYLLASQEQKQDQNLHDFLMQNNRSNQVKNSVQHVPASAPCVHVPNHGDHDQQYDEAFGSLLSTLMEDDHATVGSYGPGQVLEDPNQLSETLRLMSNGCNRFESEFGSDMSTTSSSPTPLNSNSTTTNTDNNFGQ